MAAQKVDVRGVGPLAEPSKGTAGTTHHAHLSGAKGTCPNVWPFAPFSFYHRLHQKTNLSHICRCIHTAGNGEHGTGKGRYGAASGGTREFYLNFILDAITCVMYKISSMKNKPQKKHSLSNSGIIRDIPLACSDELAA